MVGSPDDPHQKGVIPRSIEQGWKYTMQVSIKEIYNDHINDLVSSKSNLEEVYTKEVFNLLEEATNNRSVATTNMNEESSRSHFIFSLTINGKNEWNGDQVEGEINLIDLAGSEKFSASGAERESETTSINLSLHHLGQLFKALREKAKFIPFCMLTSILEHCWTGSSKTLMLINISPDPSSSAESINTLKFGHMANLTKIGNKRHRSGGFSVGKGTARRPKSGDSSVGKGSASRCRTGGLKRLV